MKFTKYILPLVASAFIISTQTIASDHGDNQDQMNAGNAPTMSLFDPYLLSIHGENAWSLFDPYLLDMPGGGKGLPVHDANDTSKIIGYVKMPEPQKPTGPVHCMVKETGLLAKSVDDCEAAGGTVAGQ